MPVLTRGFIQYTIEMNNRYLPGLRAHVLFQMRVEENKKNTLTRNPCNRTLGMNQIYKMK